MPHLPKPKTSEVQATKAVNLPLLVRRRFVVQERYCYHDQEDQWADDPDIHESVTMEDAIERLEADNAKTRGHAETWDHRIIERTESVVWTSPNDQVELPPNGGSESKKGVVGG